MPEFASEKKVRNGKYIRVIVASEDNIISKVTITGDFFIIPDEGLLEIEQSIIGLDPRRRDLIEKAIEKCVQEGEIRISGFSIQDLADLIGWQR